MSRRRVRDGTEPLFVRRPPVKMVVADLCLKTAILYSTACLLTLVDVYLQPGMSMLVSLKIKIVLLRA